MWLSFGCFEYRSLYRDASTIYRNYSFVKSGAGIFGAKAEMRIGGGRWERRETHGAAASASKTRAFARGPTPRCARVAER
jgi:hypothetical protein